MVAEEPSVTNISSLRKKGSCISKSLSSNSSLIATNVPFISVTEPILFSLARAIDAIEIKNNILIK